MWGLIRQRFDVEPGRMPPSLFASRIQCSFRKIISARECMDNALYGAGGAAHSEIIFSHAKAK
jgi:hypothetical protein